MEEQFNINESILLQDKFSKEWSKVIVVGKSQWPRSYLVKSENGKILRRNTMYLKKINKYYNFFDESEESDTNIEDIENKKENVKKEIINDDIIKTRSGRIIKKT